MRQKGKVTGLNNWVDGFEDLKQHMMDGRRQGIIKWCLMIKKKSMGNCPVRQGNLRASALVVLDDGQHGEEGQAGFTGVDSYTLNTDHQEVADQETRTVAGMTNENQIVGAVAHSAHYAAVVHEIPTAGTPGYNPEHSTGKITRGPRKGKRRRAEEVHSKVGGWKFLEKAIDESHEQGMRILQQELKVD